MRSVRTYGVGCCVVGLLAVGAAADPAVSLWVVRVNNDPFLVSPVTTIDAVPGDFLWVELRVRDWSPGGEKLRAYQLGIDYNSYFTGAAGNVLPFNFEDTTDQNGLCSGGAQGKENPYGAAISVNHPDFVFLNLSPLNTAVNTLSSCDYKLMAALTVGENGPISANIGDWFFCGYLFLVVSDDAAGTFEVAYVSHPDFTRLADPDNVDILPLQRDPLIIITPPPGACCLLPVPSCQDGITEDECVNTLGGTYMGDYVACPSDPSVLCRCSSDPDCIDGLYCTGDETCAGGDCVTTGNPCTDPALPHCDESGQTCVECLLDPDCDDGVFCSGLETCVGNICQPGVDEISGTSCGDAADTDCTDPDTCDGAGTCQDNHELPDTSCLDDGIECTDDVCDGAGACTHPNRLAGASCGDPVDTDCSNPDTCDGSGDCQVNHELSDTPCPDDGNDCTDDICDGADTCTHPDLPDDTICTDDGNDCTDDTCQVGLCTHTDLAGGTLCDDGDPCTGTGEPGIGFDTCDELGECSGVVDPNCNDTCSTAIEAFEGDNSGTNLTAGETDDAEASCQPDSNHDVWFFYDSTCTGRIFLSSTGSAAYPDLDTVLSVYDGCGMGATQLACDDDGGPGVDAALTFDAVALARYWIRVAGFQDERGTFELFVSAVDDCIIDGICYGDGELDPASPCWACIPAVSSTQWTPNPGACLIDDVCYTDGAPNPANACLECVPEVSNTGWTPRLAGTACGDARGEEVNECDNPDACDGAGVCEPNHKPDGTPCSDEGNDCTFDECDAGTCAHPPRPLDTPCGDPSDTDCDNPDTCDGGVTCLDNFEPVDLACGDPSDSDCDHPDTCNATGGCLDNLEPDGNGCTDDGNECSDDVCDGGVCDHPLLPDGAACTDDGNDCTDDKCAAGTCDHPPFLSGTGCGNPTETQCDHADTCNGAGVCLTNVEQDGTTCDDGEACMIDDQCVSGVCEGSLFPPPIVESDIASRFIKITPATSVDAPPVALRIRNLCTDAIAWVMLRDVDYNDGPQGDVNVGETMDTCDNAEFHTPSDWVSTSNGLLVVTGRIIAPATLFEVTAVCGGCETPTESSPVTTANCTWNFGDCDGDGFVYLVGDILGLQIPNSEESGFPGWTGPDPGYQMDIQGADVPDGAINLVADVLGGTVPAMEGTTWVDLGGTTCEGVCPPPP